MSRRHDEGCASYTYFFQIGTDGPIKIGYSADVYGRLAALSSGLPLEAGVDLQVIGVRKGRKHEKALHEKLAAHRIRGEWFRPAPEVLAEAASSRRLIAKIAREPPRYITKSISLSPECSELWGAAKAREEARIGVRLTPSNVFSILIRRCVEEKWIPGLTLGS